MQEMPRCVRTESDPEAEAQVLVKLQSRITTRLKDEREIAGWADERYRYEPENPLTDAEVEAKTRSCCAVVLTEAEQVRRLRAARGVFDLDETEEASAAAMTPEG